MKLSILARVYISIGYAFVVTAFSVQTIPSKSKLAFSVCRNSHGLGCKQDSSLHKLGASRRGSRKSGSSLQLSRSAGLFGRRKTNRQSKQITANFLAHFAVAMKKLRRFFTIGVASAILCLGPLSHTPLSHRPVAHASSIATKVQSQETRLDKLINNYVQQHMFDDDKFDPLESTYREIINDSTVGAYPNKLSSIASNLGATQTTSTASETSQKATSNDGIMKAMLKLVNTLEDKYNIPRSILVPVLALLCFGIPSFIIGMGALSFSFAQRGMTERMAIERYGESVLDAEEIPVEEDEDDDYDYETGEYDDDDDDEEDDDDDDDDEDEDPKK